MQWILIVGAILVIFLVSTLLKIWLAPKIKPGTRLLLSFCWFVLFAAWFLTQTDWNKKFTLFQQIVMAAFGIGYLIYFYLRYKKLAASKGNQ